MGKSWKDRPGKSWGKNYKQQKHHKKEKSWNDKNHITTRREREFGDNGKYSPFNDSQGYHESFS